MLRLPIMPSTTITQHIKYNIHPPSRQQKKYQKNKKGEQSKAEEEDVDYDDDSPIFPMQIISTPFNKSYLPTK